MSEAKVDDQYYKDVELQNSRAASKKLNEIKKKIKELKKTAKSKGHLKKLKQISELLEQHKKICEHVKNSFSMEYQRGQETTSTPKNFVKFIDENLKLSAENKNGYLFLCFVPQNILFYGNDGHALLIKKNGNNNFVFYDPNIGAVFGLTKEQLCKTVTQVFSKYTTDSKFYKYDLNDFARNRFASKFVLLLAPAVCLASFFSAVAVMVISTVTIPMILFTALSMILFISIFLVYCLSQISESKVKILYQGYTELHNLSTESTKKRHMYDSVELVGIPNISEISQLSKDVENLEEELTCPQEILQETHSSKLTHDLIRPTT